MKTILQPTLSFAILCLVAVAPTMQAVVPPPDGGYPNFNTAEGQNALFSLTTGSANTAVGWFSLWGNAEGSFNTGTGAGALLFNTADANTAFGAASLLFNTTGINNTAVGAAALLNNTLGVNNTAVGANALSSNSVSSGDTTTGGPSSGNTAVGSGALFNNTSGSFNTAIGGGALFNSRGFGNVALGASAGEDVIDANNVICIAADGQDVSNSCYIGQIYTNIQPQVGTDPDLVTINSNGRLGRANVSSRRYKHDIQTMDKASEAIYALRPVSFRYHEEYDVSQTIAFGLIAEEVAEVNRDLVGRNREGQPESVRYEQINAMLLNEFIKEHKKLEEQNRKLENQDARIQQQETTIAELKKDVETLVARIEEEASKMQRVSEQVELNKAALQLVASDR
jgi:Chaperone of endosialidase